MMMRNPPRNVVGRPLPAIIAAGQYRRLGFSRNPHPTVRITAARDLLVGTPRLDLGRIDEYDNRVTGVATRDQGQLGDCVDNGECVAQEEIRLFAGMTPELFSPAALYALTNHGIDAGSDPRDCVQVCQAIGLILAADVPPDTWILAKDLPPAALANAARFKTPPDAVYQGIDFVDLVSADALGFASTLTIRVGENFGPGPDGVAGFEPGPGNHQVCGGRAFRRVFGRPQMLIRNSWGESWGVIGGYAWITVAHIDQQVDPIVLIRRYAGSDPLDPLNPAV